MNEVDIETYYCSKCKEWKPREAFSPRKTSKSGVVPHCKVCHAAHQAAYRKKFPVKTQEIQRRSAAKRDANTRREYNRLRSMREAEKKRELGRLWRLANKEKIKVYRMVRTAIAQGVIVRPDTCERCHNRSDVIEASHSDYSQPLQIEWLCKSCHIRKDKKNPRMGEIEMPLGTCLAPCGRCGHSGSMLLLFSEAGLYFVQCHACLTIGDPIASENRPAISDAIDSWNERNHQS